MIEVAAAGATPEPEVPDFREAPGQHMLQEALQEFDAGEHGAADRLRAVVAIAKDHALVVAVFQAAVADRHPKQIARQVVEDALAVPRRLGMHHPGRGPDDGGNLEPTAQ